MVTPGASALKACAKLSTSPSNGVWFAEGHMQSILIRSRSCATYQRASDAYHAAAAALGAFVPSTSESQEQLREYVAASARVSPGAPAMGSRCATPPTGTPRMNHAPNLRPFACTAAARPFSEREVAEEGKRVASGMGSPFP